MDYKWISSGLKREREREPGKNTLRKEDWRRSRKMEED